MKLFDQCYSIRKLRFCNLFAAENGGEREVGGGGKHAHHPSSTQDSQPLSHQAPGEDGEDR